VLRSDCILHQANIDRRLSDLRSRVTATKHIRSKLRRRAHEVDVLKELKALTAASADAIKKAASPSKMRQATSNRATNAQAVGGEGGANENGNGGEGEGTQGSHNDDDDEDNDDEEEEEEGDEEEVRHANSTPSFGTLLSAHSIPLHPSEIPLLFLFLFFGREGGGGLLSISLSFCSHLLLDVCENTTRSKVSLGGCAAIG